MGRGWGGFLTAGRPVGAGRVLGTCKEAASNASAGGANGTGGNKTDHDGRKVLRAHTCSRTRARMHMRTHTYTRERAPSPFGRARARLGGH